MTSRMLDEIGQSPGIVSPAAGRAKSSLPVVFNDAVLSTLGGAAMLALGLGGIKPSAELVARLASQGLGA
jgi:hypothetical protein